MKKSGREEVVCTDRIEAIAVHKKGKEQKERKRQCTGGNETKKGNIIGDNR